MMNNEDAIIAFFFAFFAFFAVMFLIGVILYIFKAIGLFKIAKREGKEDIAWLAWIPVVNTFLMMQVLERSVHESLRGKMTLIYGILLAAGIVLGSWIPFLPILPGIFFFYAFYFLAKRYSPNPILHLVIGIITFSYSTSISIFMFRNREVVDPTGFDLDANPSNPEDPTV